MEDLFAQGFSVDRQISYGTLGKGLEIIGLEIIGISHSFVYRGSTKIFKWD